jgi:uncharacterized protein YhaN
MESRTELGLVPDLPDDAATRFREAVSRRDQAIHDLTRQQAEITERDAALSALPAMSPILAESASIEALTAHRQRIASTEKDREDQRLVAAQCAVTITGEGRRLGLTLDADTLVSRIPSALDREKVNQALRRHERLLGRRTKAIEDLAAARAKSEDARVALEVLPTVEPAVELRQAIEAVRAEGRLESDLNEADAAHRSAMGELSRALNSLPLWCQDVDTLAAAAVPLDARIQHHADTLKAKHDALQRIAARLQDHDRALLEFAATIQADEAGGEVPTNEAIQAARGRRDQAWATIRRHYADGGAAPSDANAAELAANFDCLLHVADRLSDLRAAERERVVATEQRRRDQMRRQILRDADAAEHALAIASVEQALAEWRSLWDPVGIAPAEPAAMREWLQKRGTVLAEHERARNADHRLAGVKRRHERALGILAALLPREAEEEAGQLQALLATAERLCQQREGQADRRVKAHEALDAAEVQQRGAERALSRVEVEMSAWQAEWDAATPLLSLAAGTPPELGLPALELWNEIDRIGDQRREALHRVEQMTTAINRFAADAVVVAGRVAPDLLQLPPLDAAMSLGARLAEALQFARNRNELETELARLREAVRQHEQDGDAAERILTGLRTLTGAEDDAALNEAIMRSAKHRALSDLIAERDAELHRLNDGKTLEALALEADGVDFDALPARIAEIEAQLNGINAEELANQTRMTELSQMLAAMERGQDAALAAQEMETAVADMDHIAARYVMVRMAHVLLRAGIERFRRQQQDPLLSRAGQIFSRLTEGRYDRLGVDEDEGKMLIKACRPDGTQCQADRLSEGTLDQLYLALRLAAIESYARTTEPLPFIADDLLVNFDDRRAKAAIRVLADFGKVTQVIMFTHHGHIADMAEAGVASVHRLAGSVATA